MTSKNFLSISFTLSVVIFLVLFLLLINTDNKVIFRSIIIGDAIGFLNLLLGLIFIFIGLEKPDKIFLRSVFAGILTRLIVLLTLVILTLKFLEINNYSFIFSLLFFYFFFIIIEVIYLILRKR